MGILDIFARKDKKSNESNTLFGQTALGNNIVYQGNDKRQTVNTQILYVTKIDNTVGWEAHAYTAIGAVATAVVPD